MTAAIRDGDVEALRRVFRSHNQTIESVTADTGSEDLLLLSFNFGGIRSKLRKVGLDVRKGRGLADDA